MNILDCLDYVENRYEINVEQQLILKALTTETPQNLQYFKQWLSSIDFADIPRTTLKMIPTLYNKFRDSNIDNQDAMSRMREIEHDFSLKNHSVFADAKEIIKQLVNSGVELTLFKGGALTLLYYINPTLRAMSDLDVLLTKEQMKHAEEILFANGWKYLYPENQKIKYVHSYDYANTRNNGFDLHWHALYETPIDGIDTGIRQRARSFNWDGINVKILSAEDLILTSMINGLRNFHFPIDSKTNQELHWIHDIIHIIRAENKITWEILFAEAHNRGLMEEIFHGMMIIRSIAEDCVSTEVINQLLQYDKHFYINFVKDLVSSGRTHGINPSKRAELEKFLSDDINHSTPLTPVNSNNKYIKYFLDNTGAIESLYLNYEWVSLITKIFDVHKPKVLKSIIDTLPKTGEGYLKLGKGILSLKKIKPVPRHRAKIEIVTAAIKQTFLPGEATTVELKVTNKSRSCWIISEKQKSAAVSYHLYSINDKVIIRNFSRKPFFVPRQNYLGFIMPSQQISCRVPIIMPKKPGNYTIQFDIAQNKMTSFTKRWNRFPKFKFEVVGTKDNIVF